LISETLPPYHWNIRGVRYCSPDFPFSSCVSPPSSQDNPTGRATSHRIPPFARERPLEVLNSSYFWGLGDPPWIPFSLPWCVLRFYRHVPTPLLTFFPLFLIFFKQARAGSPFSSFFFFLKRRPLLFYLFPSSF